MAQFDVHRFPGRRSDVRYVVDVQCDLLQDLATRLVVPAYPMAAHIHPIEKLNPEAGIGGVPHYLAIQEMAAVRTASLGRREGSLISERDAIIAAIDLLITGI